MARQPSFDRAEVVHAAMRVFWQRGYQRASVKELGEAMGLLPGSIYAAFGSKEALFREALDAYVARVGEAVEPARHGPREILERWFDEHITAATATPEGRGCLLLNSAFEVQSVDAAIAERVREELATLLSFFEGCIRAARSEPPSPSSGSESPAPQRPGPEATARMLVAALGGISMMSRAGMPRHTLEDVARVALRAV